MTDEQEEQAGEIPAATSTATGAVAAEQEEAAIAVAPPADASGVATIDAVGSVTAEVTAAGSAETVAAKAITTTDADAHDAAGVPPQDNARIRDSLEAIKTAVVWLVVLQLLTILSPLLRVSLKWTIIVGLILMLGSFAVGGVAYLKARSAQRGFPE